MTTSILQKTNKSIDQSTNKLLLSSIRLLKIFFLKKKFMPVPSPLQKKRETFAYII